jgi:hypothetical protein
MQDQLIGPRLRAIAPESVVAYKFMHAADKPYWLERHSVRVRDWDHYKQMEDIGGKGVADPHEGSHEIRVDMHIRGDNPADAEHFRRLNEIGHITPESPIHGGFDYIGMGTEIVRTAPSAYVLCLSTASDKETARRWSEAEGYDFIIEINDLAKFITELELASDGLLQNGRAELVEYGPQEANAREGYYTGPPLLRKDTKFDWQKEIRVSWPFSGGDTQIDVPAPNIGPLVREVTA